MHPCAAVLYTALFRLLPSGESDYTSLSNTIQHYYAVVGALILIPCPFPKITPTVPWNISFPLYGLLAVADLARYQACERMWHVPA